MSLWNCSLFLLFFFGIFLGPVPHGNAADAVVVHCECIYETPEGSVLLLVGLDAANGLEKWRKQLDTFPRGEAGKAACNSRLAAAMYCVH